MYDNKDKILEELTNRYHAETEEYNSTVCTGTKQNGVSRPATKQELNLVSLFSLETKKELLVTADKWDISKKVLYESIADSYT